MNGYCSGQIWLESDILTRTYQKLRRKKSLLWLPWALLQAAPGASMDAASPTLQQQHPWAAAGASCQLRQACLNVNLASSHCRHEQPHGSSHHKRLSNLKGEFTLSPNSKFLYRRSQIIFFLELFKQYL